MSEGSSAGGSKAEALRLMQKREGIEAEIEAISERLTRPGGPGLKDSLLDAEGFPRADIDVAIARADRHRLAVLHTDHKRITADIEAIIFQLHSEGTKRTKTDAEEDKISPEPATLASPASPVPSPIPSPLPSTLIPFAVIDQVAPSSPAEADGIRINDLLLRFGSVTDGFDCISRVASELQHNEGRRIDVVVMRGGEQVAFGVTPRAWEGRGLLGCHMQPV